MRMNFKVESACSLKNGIILYSTIKKDYGVIALLGKNNELIVKKGKIDNILNQSYGTKNTVFIVKSRLITLACLIWACISALHIEFYEVYHLICKIFTVMFITQLLTENLSKSSSRFHSAEHMSINAFEDLNRIPEVYEIQKYSRFSNFCGTNFYAFLTSIFLGLFLSSLLHEIFLEIILSFTSLVISIILYKLNFFNWVQIFTTLKPTQTELYVAKEALKAWCEYEQELENASTTNEEK